MLLTILVAQRWTSSSNVLSFLKKGAANDIPTSRCGRTSALYNFIRTLGCRLEMVLFMIPRVLFAEDETDLAYKLSVIILFIAYQRYFMFYFPGSIVFMFIVNNIFITKDLFVDFNQYLF